MFDALKMKTDQTAGEFGLRKRRVPSEEPFFPSRDTTSDKTSFRRKSVKLKQQPPKRGSFFVPNRGSLEENSLPAEEIETSILTKYVWATADIHQGFDAAYIMFSLRDFILYMIYLSILLVLTVGSHYPAYNYYSHMVRDLLIKSEFFTFIGPSTGVLSNFSSIKTPQQLWSFVVSILMRVFYDEGGLLKAGHTVLMESVLVGAPAIRQIRVLNDSCETAPLFRDLYKTCYDYYSYELKDRSDLTPDGPLKTGSAWRYFSEKILRETTASFIGTVGTYGGGGLQFNFTPPALSTLWIQELKKYNWIRIGTRFITIDFALYSPNTNLFCVAKLAFELIPAGGIIPHSLVHTFKLLRYSSPWDIFLLGCEVAFMCFTVYFTFEEAQQIYLLKGNYPANLWNFLDLTIILFSYVAILLGIYRHITVTRIVKSQLRLIRTTLHSNFDYIVHVETTFNNVVSWLIFFVWLKLLKFCSLNRSVATILSVFRYVGVYILTICFMLFFTTIGYAVCGHILFGYAVNNFISVPRSALSLISIYVGEFYFYQSCEKEYPIIAPMFFSSYIMIIVVIYGNMFIALLSYGFSEVSSFLEAHPDWLFFDDWCYVVAIHILTLLRQDYLVHQLTVRNASARFNKDYDELVMILKRHGIHGKCLQLLLDKFNIHRGGQLDLDDAFDMYNDLCARGQLFVEVQDHDDIKKFLDKIGSMMERCEQAVGDILLKTEVLTDMVVKAGAGRKK